MAVIALVLVLVCAVALLALVGVGWADVGRYDKRRSK